MEAAPVNIIQYFDGSKQGVIPLFQRPYSWEAKDWGVLWADLIAQYEEDDRSSHFMGAVVTVPVKSVPVGVGKHLVIDGQQRLTTISILLAAIRDKAESEGDLPTAGIIGDFLINRHYSSPDDLKLVPTQVDRAAYNAVVYRKDLVSFEETRIVQAYHYFSRKLGDADDEGQLIRAAQVLQAIQQSLQVVMINLGEADDPYLIFESLNHKGKPLNQADLVRNYVLMRFQHSTSAGGDQELAYEDLWRPMESALDASLPEFLRHYGMRLGRNVRKGDIYTACKVEFERLVEVENVRQRLTQMKRAAANYEKFIRPDEEVRVSLSSGLRAIQELDSTVFYPLLLRLYTFLDEQVITVEDLMLALDTLESFYVRRAVCGVPTNALNKMTLELCSNLPDQLPHLWLRDRLAAGAGGRRWPTDEEFSEALVIQKIYPRRKLARYMLEALELAHDHKEAVDASTATMEHILPQTLSAAWIDQLGSGHAVIHDKWLDTLGNLTLTGYNSELGNSPFAEKKGKLANTHFELSRDIISQGVWGATEIEARGRRLSNMALQRWARD
ncbi:DUF262 domain-containing protein [Stenotrophomonas sp. YIM B06876]|uniref:DUF262 domain-containing protein n=1 Tax=Stenotrophomonas sp. YIM B06876 TaxID=3060211 RepID=UPI002738C728|nr:DUF262 domain-containing protein [Stenotrophomonas sp. YIM B06876]